MSEEPMIILHCCNCDIRFDVTKRFYKQRLEDGEGYYCPNGHGQAFCDSLLEQHNKVLAQNETLARENRELKQQVPRRDARGQFCGREG